MDVRGCLGISDDVRNGFEQIRVTFSIEGDAPEEKLREVLERATARSAVFDMISHGVPTYGGARPMTLALRASTEAGARLCALADVLADDLATRAAAHDRAATFPHASSDALREASYFAAPIPKGSAGSGSARCTTWSSLRCAWPPATPRSRSASTCTSSPSATWSASWRSPSIAATSGGAAAVAKGLESLAARRRDPRRDQRAQTGPAAAVDDRDECGGRLADRRPQDLLHGRAGCNHALRVGDLHRRDRRPPLRIRHGARARPRRHGPRRLGRARHARVRQPLRDVRRRAAAARGGERRLPRRQRGPVHGAQPERGPVPRLLLARDRRGRREARRSPASRSAARRTGAPARSRPRTPWT